MCRTKSGSMNLMMYSFVSSNVLQAGLVGILLNRCEKKNENQSSLGDIEPSHTIDEFSETLHFFTLNMIASRKHRIYKVYKYIKS